jgi:hypothetical protein
MFQPAQNRRAYEELRSLPPLSELQFGDGKNRAPAMILQKGRKRLVHGQSGAVAPQSMTLRVRTARPPGRFGARARERRLAVSTENVEEPKTFICS